ncbi:transglycosylase domain-containing protein [Microbacterium sp. Root553]|uniref:transglycosylase domain-containing protein n=1 Tax=Microbacterium sp. Root553 TaxID=1736556 RepID=UPI0006F62842|nr:transglycosylase domain-containing protein [Microbacterium sp. Root553]KQZ22631.1 thioredoxin [Microbacterium sp. Root553]
MPQKNRTVKGALGGVLGLVGLSAVAGLLVAASVTPVLAMTGIAGSQALNIFEDLPENLQVDAPMQQSTIYATGLDGNPVALASFYEQKRVPVAYDQIAPVMYDAILSSEDKNFYTHGGINLGATVKAAVGNVAGTTDRGASTITQQYVKNVQVQECEQNVDTAAEDYAAQVEQCFLDAAVAKGGEGVERKLQEMRFALQIEKEYSKNAILLGYLNIANFGGTIYGIEAAANRYFSTSAANLTLVQAATIAGMVQEPNRFRIDRPEGIWTDDAGVAHNGEADGYQETKERRDYVLNRLLADKKITQAAHDEAVATPVTPALSEPQQGCGAAGDNAYFCQYVKEVIENDPAFGDTEAERKANLRRGGMQIYTSLDLRVQQTAIDAVKAQVPQAMPGILVGGTGVSIEATTGRVLAMAQNTVFNETSEANLAAGETSQVFAADKQHGGSTYGFETGSTYKLFTLLAWLESGHSVNQVLDGRLKTFSPFTRCGDRVTNSAKINNFGNSGGSVGSVRQFTAQSLNTGFLAMAQQLDLCKINEVAKRLGVHYGNGDDITVGGTNVNVAPNDPFPTVLGSKSVAPLQIAGAYATVANNGIFCEPRVIDRVIGPDGAEITPPQEKCSQQLTPEVAATAAYALRGVMEGNGTGIRANPGDGTQLIGKTGTAEKEHTMLVESSTKVTTAVWVGNIDGREPLNSFRNGEGTRLGDIRYGLARAIQGAADAVYPADPFPRPDDKLVRQVLTDVPNVVGKSVGEATSIIEAAGFSVAVGEPVDGPAGDVVVAQDPSGQAPSGATITISPSNGQGVTVPDITGQSKSAAQSALFGAGFSSISFDSSCNPPNSVVSSTDPAANTSANRSTAISVTCR